MKIQKAVDHRNIYTGISNAHNYIIMIYKPIADPSMVFTVMLTSITSGILTVIVKSMDPLFSMTV